MNATLKGSYRNAKGTLVFLYAVVGTAAELEKYDKAQGDNLRKAGPNDERGIPEGTRLWFTTRTIGEKGKLIITAKGRVIGDMSAFEMQANLAEQFGGNLGSEMAKNAASRLMGTQDPAIESVSTDDVEVNQE